MLEAPGKLQIKRGSLARIASFTMYISPVCRGYFLWSCHIVQSADVTWRSELTGNSLHRKGGFTAFM